MARFDFEKYLTSKLSRGPSRFMWFGGERNIDATERRLTPIIEEIIVEAVPNAVRR